MTKGSLPGSALVHLNTGFHRKFEETVTRVLGYLLNRRSTKAGIAVNLHDGAIR
jgi:hypothetical protein